MACSWLSWVITRVPDRILTSVLNFGTEPTGCSQTDLLISFV